MTLLSKPIKRKTRISFMHYRVPLVAELLPGDLLRLRLLRHRREVLFNLHDLYFTGVRRDIIREKREKDKAKNKKGKKK